MTDSAGTTLGFPQVLTVTALVAGVMTLAMGLWANYPFAIASGLGLNAFVAFTLVAGSGLTWPEAMGVIVVEGLVITLLVLTGFRNAILNAIPMDLKRAIAIGIGLFLTIIGLVNAGDRGPAETADPSARDHDELHLAADPDVRDRARSLLDPRRAQGAGRSPDRHHRRRRSSRRSSTRSGVTTRSGTPSDRGSRRCPIP